MDRDSDEFVKLLTSCQSGLYACILSLMPDRVTSQDILQETNLTLWHKADEFEEGTNFMAWASRIARYHVLNFRRAKNRDQLVFDEELFRTLCERQAISIEDTPGSHAEALRECLKKLPKEHHALIEERYAPQGAVSRIAESRGQSVGAVSQMLYRIRESILNCVSLRLQEGNA